MKRETRQASALSVALTVFVLVAGVFRGVVLGDWTLLVVLLVLGGFISVITLVHALTYAVITALSDRGGKR